MESMMAYCGLECSACPAFLATQNDDDSAREKVAQEWSRLFQADIKPDSVNCDGCRSGERKFGYCAACEIRSCGEARDVDNCAFCPKYPCVKLTAFFKYAPLARENLERIRGAV